MSKFLHTHGKFIFLFFNLWFPKGKYKINWNNLTVSTFPILNQMSSRLVEVKLLELHVSHRCDGMRLEGWKRLRKKLLTPSSCLCVTQHLCPASSADLVRPYCLQSRCNLPTQKAKHCYLFCVLCYEALQYSMILKVCVIGDALYGVLWLQVQMQKNETTQIG